MSIKPIEATIDSGIRPSASYACAAFVVVSVHNGRRPGGETLWGFDLGEAQCVPERNAQEGDILATPETRARHLRDLRFFLQEDVVAEVGTLLNTMISVWGWNPAGGLEGADECIALRSDGDEADSLALRVEKHLIAEALNVFTDDLLESPFIVRWTNHIGVLYEIELLNGNSTEGRDLLLAEYDEAARILLKNWALVQKLALAMINAADGKVADDPVWEFTMKLFGERFNACAPETASE